MNLSDWIAAVVSPATFAFVLVAELRYRRRYLGVSWWLHFDHAENDDDTDEPRYYHYALMNLGTEAATNVSVNSTSGVQTSGSSLTAVKAGDNHPNLRIESDDFDNDWLLVTWTDTSDRRYVWLQWFPMNSDGPLQDYYMNQWDAALKRRWWTRIFRRTKPVGPGAGVRGTSVRTNRNQDKFDQDMSKARSLLEATNDQRVLRRNRVS